MPTCARCGQANPAGARFCLTCGSPLAAAGERREVRRTVTVVFSDLVGSTALGERLDPELLREVMTRYYDRAAAVLERHGGTAAWRSTSATCNGRGSTFWLPVLPGWLTFTLLTRRDVI